MKSKFGSLISVVLIIMFTLNIMAGCGGELASEIDDESKFVTLDIYMPFNTPDLPLDLKKVQEEVNKILREEINAEINMTGFNISEYGGKVNAAVASSVKFDLLWTDFESYYRYLDMEALYPLDNLLENYGKDVYNDMQPQLWNQVKKDGKIFGAPNIQILPRAGGFTVANEDFFKDFMSKYDFTETDMVKMPLAGVSPVYIPQATNAESWGKLDVLENYLKYLAKENLGQGGITYGFELPYFLESFCGFDSLSTGMNVPGVVRAVDGDPKVFNQFESEEFKTTINYLEKWYKSELIPADVDQSSYTIGNLDFIPERTWKPDNRTSYVQGGKTKYRYTYQISEPNYLQSYILGTMWSISATSQNPGRSMKFLNLLHKDARIHNLLKLGVEGTHYELVNEGKQAKQLPASARYNNNDTRWVLGNELIGLPLDIQSANVFETTKEINEKTPISKVIGFVFDRSNVVTEIQLCSDVCSTYLSMGYGKILAKDPNYYTKFITALNNAGMKKIINEKQNQLSEWLKK